MTNDAWQRVVDQMRREISKFAPRLDLPDGLLYHYTNAEGLLGILGSSCMHLTHYEYLNDPSEVTSGLQLMHGILQETRSAVDHHTPRGFFVSATADAFQATSITNYDIYLASFSTIGDSLPQWVAYGGNGYGYAIGFRVNVVTRQARSSHDAAIVRCLYDEAVLAQEIREYLELSSSAFEKYARTYSGIHGDVHAGAMRLYEEASIPVLLAMSASALKLKSPHYRGEDEWRICQLWEKPCIRGGIKFRSGHQGIVPYTELPFLIGEDPCSVEKIIVGPCGDQGNRVKSVQRFVSEHDLKCEVVASDVKYRGGRP